jgi:hypothetical protein
VVEQLPSKRSKFKTLYCQKKKTPKWVLRTAPDTSGFCHPSHSGGKGQEDRSSKSAHAK